jgi:hypothetical protein
MVESHCRFPVAQDCIDHVLVSRVVPTTELMRRPCASPSTSLSMTSTSPYKRSTRCRSTTSPSTLLPPPAPPLARSSLTRSPTTTSMPGMRCPPGFSRRRPVTPSAPSCANYRTRSMSTAWISPRTNWCSRTWKRGLGSPPPVASPAPPAHPLQPLSMPSPTVRPNSRTLPSKSLAPDSASRWSSPSSHSGRVVVRALNLACGCWC